MLRDDRSQYHDGIGVRDGGQTVGDDQRGTAFHQHFERLLNLVFTLTVEGTGGLVQQES